MANGETGGEETGVSASVPSDRAWRVHSRGGPFTTFTGPYHITRDALEPGEPIRFGFVVREEHCNPRWVCHGGMLATFLDAVLAGGLLALPGIASPAITISMTLDYLAPAHLGEWIESRVLVPRLTQRTGFAQAMLIGPHGPVLRGSGVFKIARKP